MAAGELQRGEKRTVSGLIRALVLKCFQQLAEVRSYRLRCERPQVRADQFQRERMIGQIAQQRVEFVLREAWVAQRQAIPFQNAMQQPQAIGPGEAVQFLPLCAGQAGVARPAGDEQTAAAGTSREIVKEVGEATSLLIGVGAGGGLRIKGGGPPPPPPPPQRGEGSPYFHVRLLSC